MICRFVHQRATQTPGEKKTAAYNISQPLKGGMKFVVHWRAGAGDSCGVQYKGDARGEQTFPIKGFVSGVGAQHVNKKRGSLVRLL